MTEWDKQAYQLWRLLDHIDTTDDACREDDQLFRKQVMEIQKKRWSIIDEEQIDELFNRFSN